MNESEYETLISQLVSDFERTIPKHDKDREELIAEFRIFLAKEINQEPDNPVIKASKFLRKRTIESTASKFINAELQLKKKGLLKDESFEKLKIISDKAFELAKQTLLASDKVVSNMNSDKTEKLANKLNELRDSVRDFNKEEAGILASETILDINLIYYPGARIVSTRIGEIFMQLPKWQRDLLRKRAKENQAKYHEKEKEGEER